MEKSEASRSGGFAFGVCWLFVYLSCNSMQCIAGSAKEVMSLEMTDMGEVTFLCSIDSTNHACAFIKWRII